MGRRQQKWQREKEKLHCVSRHHIRPRSRGGSDAYDNIIIFPPRFHQIWHQLFKTLTPREAIIFIKLLYRRKSVDWDQIDRLRQEVMSYGAN